jgi:hypothetical protein
VIFIPEFLVVLSLIQARRYANYCRNAFSDVKGNAAWLYDDVRPLPASDGLN